MLIYKIKHKETGQFYCSSRRVKSTSGQYVRSNLSLKGQIYQHKPNLKMYKTYRSHLDPQHIKEHGGQVYSLNIHCVPEETWEIIEL